MLYALLPPSSQHLIGSAARLSGVTVASIRFYEKENLLSPSRHRENGYRFYSDEDIHQLRFIRLCRLLGIPLDDVRGLLGMDIKSQADCGTARAALGIHLAQVRARLSELQALEKDLQAMYTRCDGSDAHCYFIETLHERADALPATREKTRPSTSSRTRPQK